MSGMIELQTQTARFQNFFYRGLVGFRRNIGREAGWNLTTRPRRSASLQAEHPSNEHASKPCDQFSDNLHDLRQQRFDTDDYRCGRQTHDKMASNAHRA